MRQTAVLTLGLFVALALPAGALAKPTKTDERNAATECKLERGSTETTNAAFAAKYKNFGACVSTRTRDEAQQRKQAKAGATRDCRAEREADPAAFLDKYGTNPNRRNAFGKCIASSSSSSATGTGPRGW